MYHIALCDDEALQRQITGEILDRYIAGRKLAATVRKFSGGQELLNAMYDETFDIYILDIVMPEMNGIELGFSLRKAEHKTGQEGAIIYLTTSPDFALEGYHAKAAAYLLKPVQEKELYAALDIAIETLSDRHEKSLLIKTAEGTVRLSFDNILYVEQIDRIPHYYLRDGSCVSGITMRASYQETMTPLLADSRFCLCGASFVFNLHHIRSITKNTVTLADGKQVAVPKRAVAALHTAWMQYWLKGGSKNV